MLPAELFVGCSWAVCPPGMALFPCVQPWNYHSLTACSLLASVFSDHLASAVKNVGMQSAAVARWKKSPGPSQDCVYLGIPSLTLPGSHSTSHFVLCSSCRPTSCLCAVGCEACLVESLLNTALSTPVTPKSCVSAFQTPTGMPYGTVNLLHGVNPGETPVTCTAGIGTFIVEFATLSHLTGDPVFEDVARKALKALWKNRSDIGLVSEECTWNVLGCFLCSFVVAILNKQPSTERRWINNHTAPKWAEGSCLTLFLNTCSIPIPALLSSPTLSHCSVPHHMWLGDKCLLLGAAALVTAAVAD